MIMNSEATGYFGTCMRLTKVHTENFLILKNLKELLSF